jgi:hypothetical protein
MKKGVLSDDKSVFGTKNSLEHFCGFHDIFVLRRRHHVQVNGGGSEESAG